MGTNSPFNPSVAELLEAQSRQDYRFLRRFFDCLGKSEIVWAIANTHGDWERAFAQMKQSYDWRKAQQKKRRAEQKAERKEAERLEQQRIGLRRLGRLHEVSDL